MVADSGEEFFTSRRDRQLGWVGELPRNGCFAKGIPLLACADLICERGEYLPEACRGVDPGGSLQAAPEYPAVGHHEPAEAGAEIVEGCRHGNRDHDARSGRMRGG
jgi:hypothetical protein